MCEIINKLVNFRNLEQFLLKTNEIIVKTLFY